MDQLLVFLEGPGSDERLATLITGHRVLVLLEVGLVGRVAVEYFATFNTGRLLPSTEGLVYLHVSDQGALHSEGPGTLAALEGFVLGVDPEVSDQVTRLLELPEHNKGRS